MPKSDREDSLRESAYYIWEREGRPDGRAREHWHRAMHERPADPHAAVEPPMGDEEKVLAGRADANFPALLTKDVLGG
jgi:Protein of unknown function (DUF2934)